jgi:metallothiol transferase fosB
MSKGSRKNGLQKILSSIYMIHIHELPWWKKLLGGLGIAVFILLGLVLVWLFFIYGAIILATVAIIYFIRKYFL